MPPRDIAIAGCGPAGLAAALLLHRDGHRVALYERFETARPVGSGLMIQPTGRAVLRALGLEATTAAAGAPIERLFGLSEPSGRAVLDVRYDALGADAPRGIGIHRAALFHTLHEAVRAEGIPVFTGRPISSSTHTADGRRHVVFADGTHSAPVDLVVDALGTSSPLAPPTGRPLPYGALWATLDWVDDAGFDAEALEQRYERASRMVGVLPIGRTAPDGPRKLAFFWSLRADHLEAWRSAGLAPWKAEAQTLWPRIAPLLAQIDDPAQLTFARYAHRTLPVPTEPGLIHLGDAWHSTSPQLGQGANMALLDAYALALALRQTDTVAAACTRAVALRRAHVRLYQGMSTLFTPVYQSDGTLLPLARDWIAGPLAKIWPLPPLLATIVSGLVGDPLARLGLEG
ncbi:putative FAD-dependent monooxygenase [Azorhizobium caulinodans ORS 571]|uniref:Putative FAD-dependent monooxygenase n=1 Tax=Azorhizobium caulinodans (strain ATCC 43989 / DSM 5975 / JCM 20966 / LMG 6465 / NBRC 14845 / NCIMB 13405 / ORS 571) TaxID=438753 RepID=A8IF05_AZOC5|nr:NAD(P)/FAD-dependent oxidoreductase [Azorhizobium caulinodans]BAF89557.1 putative FAD-dependent monooxygenase [Azorhizobium caulinodans ORS 571]